MVLLFSNRIFYCIYNSRHKTTPSKFYANLSMGCAPLPSESESGSNSSMENSSGPEYETPQTSRQSSPVTDNTAENDHAPSLIPITAPAPQGNEDPGYEADDESSSDSENDN